MAKILRASFCIRQQLIELSGVSALLHLPHKLVFLLTFLQFPAFLLHCHQCKLRQQIFLRSPWRIIDLSAQTPSTNIPALPMANNLSTSTPLDNSHEPPMRCLPWDTPGASITSLYKTKAPNLKYPSGSQDEAVNERFLKRMDF